MPDYRTIFDTLIGDPRYTANLAWRKHAAGILKALEAVERAGVRISDPKSHASLALAFLAGHCEDRDLLAFNIIDGCTTGK